jgi:hypothetical protein
VTQLLALQVSLLLQHLDRLAAAGAVEPGTARDLNNLTAALLRCGYGPSTRDLSQSLFNRLDPAAPAAPATLVGGSAAASRPAVRTTPRAPLHTPASMGTPANERSAL